MRKSLQMNAVSSLLLKIRRVVGYFNLSNTAAALLKQKQQSLNLAHHKSIIDVETMWNSALDMTTASNISNEFLPDSDISCAEELVTTVLTPFKTVTVALC